MQGYEQGDFAVVSALLQKRHLLIQKDSCHDVGEDLYDKKKSQNQKQCSSPSSYPWPYICLKTKSQSITNICMQKVIQIYSDNGAQFKCTVINDGHDKLKQMSTNLKGISRKLKRYTKTLNQITRFMDET